MYGIFRKSRIFFGEKKATLIIVFKKNYKFSGNPR